MDSGGQGRARSQLRSQVQVRGECIRRAGGLLDRLELRPLENDPGSALKDVPHPSLSRTSPKGCPKHQGHKGEPGVTPGPCGAGGEKAQVILVWVRAPGVGNASHPRRLGVMRVRP